MRSVRRGGNPSLRGDGATNVYNEKIPKEISMYKKFDSQKTTSEYTVLEDYTKTSENYTEFENQFKTFVDTLTEKRYLVRKFSDPTFTEDSNGSVYAVCLHLKIETDSELDDEDPKKYQYIMIKFNGTYGEVYVYPSATEVFYTKTYIIEDTLQSSLFRLIDVNLKDITKYNPDKYEDLYKKVPVVLDANENLDFYKNVYLTLTEIPFLECMGWDYRGRCRVAGYAFQDMKKTTN